jgi:DNA-binding NarL/FixJ family response regulator
MIEHRAGGTRTVAIDAVALSAIEVEILRLLAAGHTQAKIAGDLFLSKSTVSAFVSRCLRQLRLSNTTELVAYAIHRGTLSAASWPLSSTGIEEI